MNFWAHRLSFACNGYFIYMKDEKIVEAAEAECLQLTELNSLIVTYFPYFPCFQRYLDYNQINHVTSDAFGDLNDLTTL